MLAKRGTKAVYTIVPNERIWTSVLVAINSVGETMPNYYVFKEKNQGKTTLDCVRMEHALECKKVGVWIYLISANGCPSF